MLEINGTQYELKFNLERLKLIERSINKPLVSIYVEQKGAFSLDQMEKVFIISLKEEGSDFFCSNAQAKKVFNEAIQRENGYQTINNMIAQRLQEDCPFLFPSAC